MDALGDLAHGEIVVALLEEHLAGDLENMLFAFPDLALFRRKLVYRVHHWTSSAGRT